MGTLFSALQTSSNALDAFSRALGAEQTNIANSSSPGYAAQRVSVASIGPNGLNGTVGDFITLTSTGDARSDALVQSSSSDAAYSQTQTQQLTPINQAFDITGSTGILAAFQQFSTAFSNLSVSPNDRTLGATALTAAGNVASAFRSAAASIDSVRTQNGSAITTTVSEINQLASQIQQLNVRSAGTSAADPSTDANLRSALDQLSSLVDITVTKNQDGTVSVLAGGQLPLVLSTKAFGLSADLSGTAGIQISSSAGGSSPAGFSGQLGALLDTRNGAIAQLLGAGGSAGSLNALAAGFASRVNTLLSSGTTATGAAGGSIFSYDTSDPTNTARTLTLDSTITASQLGLASANASNGIANQLAALIGSDAAADQISGLSAQDLFGAIASAVGQQLSDARTAATTSATNLTAAQSARQLQSGVSLDQEAVNITAYERSYQAAAKVISVIDQLTSDTVNLIR
jgi:flagellar hook-associated protein 1